MRIALKILIAVVILVVASLAALPFIIDPNDYKDEISSQVEKATGRTLTLQGDIGLSVFPWIALQLGPLSLSNAKGFPAESFAQVEAAEIRIKLLPLLKKQLEMDTVVLDGLVLNLETDKNGKTNWDDLTETKEKHVTPEQKPTTKEESSAPALAAISIAGVKLTNANILWADAAKGENYQLRNLNLNTDPLQPGEPTEVAMDFDLISGKPEVKAHVGLKTEVTVDIENQHYKLTGLDFSTLAQGKALPFTQADLALKADVDADMKQQTVTVSDMNLKLKANNDKQTIDTELNGQVSSNLTTQQTQIKALAIKANITDPALSEQPLEIKLNTDVMADLKQQKLSLSDLVVAVQDLMLEANINATKILSDQPNYNGNVHIKPFNLRKLASSMKVTLPETADNSTLEMIELKSAVEGSTSSVTLKQLEANLDQSKLTGQLAINNFAKPAFNFNLKLDEIDADRYMPPVKENESKPASSPATAAGGSAELPLDALRQINAKGTLDIGKLKATGVRSENIHVTIDAADGLVKLTPMSADLYQGKYNGNVILDARGKALQLAIDEKIANVQAGPLLQDMTGKAQISGTANANAKLTGKGINVDEIKQTLTGNGGFSFTDGALQGINIAESIRKAKAALKGETLPESNEPVQTDFSALSGTFTATNGLIDNQDLSVKSPLLRVTGAGQANLPTEAINYGLKVSIVGTSKGQGGKELDDLKGLTIPVKIGGTFSQPKPSVDLASLVQDKAKQELKTKAEEQIKQKLGDDIGGLLGGALGGNTKSEPAASEAAPADSQQQSEPAPQEQPKTPDQQLEDAVKNKLKGFF